MDNNGPIGDCPVCKPSALPPGSTAAAGAERSAMEAWEEFTESDDCASTGDSVWYAFRAGWLAGRNSRSERLIA